MMKLFQCLSKGKTSLLTLLPLMMKMENASNRRDAAAGNMLPGYSPRVFRKMPSCGVVPGSSFGEHCTCLSLESNLVLFTGDGDQFL